MVGPHSSNFRVITTNFLGVRLFRKFTVYTFFHDFIHVYSPGAGADRQHPGDKVLMSTETSCHFIHLKNVILYNFLMI